MTTIAEIMTRGVDRQRDDTLQAAAADARARRRRAAGRRRQGLAGIVTDRDIAVRGVAAGMIPQESLVSDVMTE